MEELFCIGCGAPIQTENKEGLGYTPQSALEKGLETGRSLLPTLFPSTSLQ